VGCPPPPPPGPRILCTPAQFATIAHTLLRLPGLQIIEGHTICALGDAAAWPVQGLIKHFRCGSWALLRWMVSHRQCLHFFWRQLWPSWLLAPSCPNLPNLAALRHAASVATAAPCRPQLEERIRERQRLRAQNQLPEMESLHGLHRKPQHRYRLAAGSRQQRRRSNRMVPWPPPLPLHRDG
jgi:hypothetical protein